MLSYVTIAGERSLANQGYSEHPEITLDSIIPYPWSQLEMTQHSMKPGYPFARDKKPVWPYLIGIPAGGVAVYFFSNADDDSISCDLNIESSISHQTCGQSDGSIAIGVSSDDDYSVQWSNGSTAESISGLEAGVYSVSVSVAGTSCNLTRSFTINALEPDFSISVETTPATCTLSDGQARILVNPSGMYQYIWSDGTREPHNQNLPKGEYTVTVSTSPSCSKTLSFVIESTEVPLHAVNDSFKIGAGQELNANLLLNDIGLGLQLSQVLDVSGGSLSFLPNGDFIFKPEASNSGPATFSYVLTDRCAQVDTANVHIEIERADCDFDVSFDVQNASCGDDDGSIHASVFGTGNYEYIWENGETGHVIQGVAAGSYELSITDLDKMCELVFTATVEEDEVDYIIDFEVVQPDCSNEAKILIELDDSDRRSYAIEIFYPNGIHYIETSDELVNLGDYIPINPGDFIINVWDIDIAESCIDILELFIFPPEDMFIELVEITAASSPTAADGAITIQLVSVGVAPYLVLLNGFVEMLTSESLITIKGLQSAEYSVQLLDSNECPSNIIEAFVPFETKIQFAPATGMMHQTSFSENPELPGTEFIQGEISFRGSLAYKLADRNFTSSFYTIQQSRNQRHYLLQTTELYGFTMDNLNISFNSGVLTPFNAIQSSMLSANVHFSTHMIPQYKIELFIGATLRKDHIYPMMQLFVSMPQASINTVSKSSPR